MTKLHLNISERSTSKIFVWHPGEMSSSKPWLLELTKASQTPSCIQLETALQVRNIL